jgi:hypothetical protein
MMSPAPTRFKRGSARSSFAEPAVAARSQIALIAESGRKLASRSERIRRESLVMDRPYKDDSDEISDEQLDAVFSSYAKESGTAAYPTLNVMQFSTIWRLITGERGNLFQEMKIFNQ